MVSRLAYQTDVVVGLAFVSVAAGVVVAYLMYVRVSGWALADGALVMCAVFVVMAAMAGVRYARRRWFPNVLIAAVFSSAAIITMLLVWGL